MECGVRKKVTKSPFALMCDKVEQLKCDKLELEKKLEEEKNNNALNTFDIFKLKGWI